MYVYTWQEIQVREHFFFFPADCRSEVLLIYCATKLPRDVRHARSGATDTSDRESATTNGRWKGGWDEEDGGPYRVISRRGGELVYSNGNGIPVAIRCHRFPLRNDISVRFYPHRVMPNNAAETIPCVRLSRAHSSHLNSPGSPPWSSRISRDLALFRKFLNRREICCLSKILTRFGYIRIYIDIHCSADLLDSCLLRIGEYIKHSQPLNSYSSTICVKRFKSLFSLIIISRFLFITYVGHHLSII